MVYAELPTENLSIHPAQERIYFDKLMYPDSAHYNTGGYIKLKGKFDIDCFRKAIEISINKLDIFSLQFEFSSEHLHHDFDASSKRNTNIKLVDLSQSENPTSKAKDWVQKYFAIQFDFDQEYLYENTLIKVNELEYWCVNKIHSILTDEDGYINYINLVAKTYTGFVGNLSLEWLQGLPRYEQCVDNKTKYLTSDEYKKDQHYWVEQFPTLTSPLLSKKTLTGPIRSGHYEISLSSEKKDQIVQQDKNYGEKLIQLSIAALSIYFAKTNNAENTVFGIPVHKRFSKDEQHTVGLMAGIIPFKTEVNSGGLLSDFIQQIDRQLENDYKHQRYPINHLKRDLKKSIGLVHYLFDIQINYDAFNFGSHFDTLTSSFENLSSKDEITPLHVSWCDYGNNQPLKLKLNYRNDYFTADEAALLADRLISMLLNFEKYNDQPINAIPTITPKETQKLLIDWNQTAAPYPKSQCIHDLFEEQAVRNPDALAIAFESDQMTYGVLNKKANQLAHYLVVEQGVKPNTLVGLCTKRSLDMIIGLLGILKAGGAYVPLEPSVTKTRLQTILDDCQPTVLLTQTHLTSLFGDYSGQLICLDSDWHTIENYPASHLSVESQPNGLAYVIYTSGSTGKPKGVLQRHKTLVNLVHQQALDGQLTHAMQTLQFTNFSFDVALQEIVTSWFTGSCLVLMQDEARRNMPKLVDVLSNQKIERLFIVPALLTVLMDYLVSNKVRLNNLKEIVTAGEALQITSSFKIFFQEHPCCCLWSHYGPSETHVVTVQQVTEFTIGDYPPIGKALKNHQCYVVNQPMSLS